MQLKKKLTEMKTACVTPVYLCDERADEVVLKDFGEVSNDGRGVVSLQVVAREKDRRAVVDVCDYDVQ